MMDLTDEMMAPAEAVVINWDAVKAALPLIEAAFREQIAREIEAHGPGMFDVSVLASIARGES